MRGRTQTPAEVALRLPILKHVQNWSYDTLEREVRRLRQAIGPEAIGVRSWR